MTDTPNNPPNGSADPGQPPLNPPPAAAPAGPPASPPAFPMYPPYPPPKKTSIWTKIFGSVFLSILLVSIVANVYQAFIIKTLIAGPSERPYADGTTDDRVVILPINGTINDEMAAYVRSALRSIKADKDDLAALVLRINSGGGGVTASDQILHHLKEFKADTGVPVVASFGSVAASGGYYIATAADHIYCEETGITGSIGVMAQVPTVEGLLQKVGVDMNVIVADGSPSKDTANNIFTTWEEGDANYETVTRLLNSAYDRFLQVVKQGRPNLTDAQAQELASGRVFTAEEAVSNGLVDEVGYLSAAITKAASLAQMEPGEPRVTVISRPGSISPLSLLLSHEKPGASLPDLSAGGLRDMAEELGEVRLSYRMVLK
ncbi:MAG: signal peptide peptidase SppA [Planctomycetota bacterium]